MNVYFTVVYRLVQPSSLQHVLDARLQLYNMPASQSQGRDCFQRLHKVG